MANQHSSRPWKSEFRDDVEIESLPELEWLVEGILPARRFSVLYGPPEAGKTFLLLDWALSITTGRPWNGRQTKHGGVVYVLGEGMGGLARRLAAWKKHHGHVGLAGVHFAMDCPHLMNRRLTSSFINGVKQFEPELVVFDTLARVMSGGDEDGAQDMGIFVDVVEEIIEGTGAAVCAAHHPLKGKPHLERGSGALRGAADAMWRLEAHAGGELTLKCEKQKDSEHGADIPLRRTVVDLGDGVSSCVIEVAEAVTEGSLRLTDREVEALRCLAEQPDRSLRHSAWQRAPHGIPERTFDRTKSRLVEAGLVLHELLPGRQSLYRLTDAGLAATANQLPTNCHGNAPPTTAATPPLSLEGEAAGGSDGLDRLGNEPIDDPPAPRAKPGPRRPRQT